MAKHDPYLTVTKGGAGAMTILKEFIVPVFLLLGLLARWSIEFPEVQHSEYCDYEAGVCSAECLMEPGNTCKLDIGNGLVPFPSFRVCVPFGNRCWEPPYLVRR